MGSDHRQCLPKQELFHTGNNVIIAKSARSKELGALPLHGKMCFELLQGGFTQIFLKSSPALNSRWLVEVSDIVLYMFSKGMLPTGLPVRMFFICAIATNRMAVYTSI